MTVLAIQKLAVQLLKSIAYREVKMDLANLGSQTAKNGFKNEKDIVDRFNHWQSHSEAQDC